MTTWIRFEHGGEIVFGTLEGETVTIYDGDPFGQHTVTESTLHLSDVTLMTPCVPTKILGLWNNFHATAEKTGLPHPAHPWYFVMTPNTYAAPNTTIRKPAACEGKILFDLLMELNADWCNPILDTAPRGGSSQSAKLR